MRVWCSGSTQLSGMGGGLPFAACAALLACAGGMTFLMRVCLRWFPAVSHYEETQ